MIAMSKCIEQTEYKKTIEDSYWFHFIDWCKQVSIEPRNGEDINMLFWYWYIRYVPNDTNYTVNLSIKLPEKDNQ